MNEHKTYCDECEYLQERPIKAEVPMDSGNYIVTGSRFYCSKHQKWWSIHTTIEQVGFSYCMEGAAKQ